MNFQTPKTQSRLRISSIVSRVALAVALTLSANGAMAAAAHVKARTTPPAASRRGLDVAAMAPYPNYTRAAGPKSQRNGRFNAAARPAYPYPVGEHFGAGPGINVGQLVGTMLGMVPPQYAGIVQSAMRRAASHRSSGRSSGTYDPSFDSPSSSTPVDNSQSQAAIDTTDQAIQQMDQNLFQMDETVDQ
jgi:hypothetical protein